MEEMALEIISCLKDGNKILVCGNGGSAEMANHFVAELVNHFKKPRKALAAISLASNIANITAIANDSDFKYVFSRQLEALGKPGDILITMSTSGTSANILEAKKTARDMKIKVISFPTNYENALTTPRTQEIHLKLLHDISEKVEDAFA